MPSLKDVAPRLRQMALMLAASALYVGLFIALYPFTGAVVAVLVLLPVTVVAWSLGGALPWIAAAIVARLWSIVLNLPLFWLVGDPDPLSVVAGQQGVIGTIAIIFVGALVAWLRQALDRRTRFAVQLETTAGLSHSISSLHDPEALLLRVVELLQEHFTLYYVQAYLLDEAGEFLELQVGAGPLGQALRAQHHAIPLKSTRSLVARAAQVRQIVLSNDVRADPSFLPNPLLPETRSELALPLLAYGKLLGVLDLQDRTKARFRAEESQVLSILAGQIAVALHNAHLFTAMEATTAQLRQADRLKSQFLASVSHELRTPLNAIIGYTEVMLMGIDGPLSDAIQEDVEAIHLSGKNLLRLVNDILDLAKIEAGRLTLERELVDVASILAQARMQVEGCLREKPLVLEMEVAEALPRLWADPFRLGQVVTNLLTNAIKFTEQGAVRVRAHQDAGQVVIKVSDTGIGISTEGQRLLFQEFRQVTASAMHRSAGAGLGLAISRHLVELHGGTLTVQSEPGKGSTFTIYLPLEPPEAAGMTLAGHTNQTFLKTEVPS